MWYQNAFRPDRKFHAVLLQVVETRDLTFSPSIHYSLFLFPGYNQPVLRYQEAGIEQVGISSWRGLLPPTSQNS